MLVLIGSCGLVSWLTYVLLPSVSFVVCKRACQRQYRKPSSFQVFMQRVPRGVVAALASIVFAWGYCSGRGWLGCFLDSVSVFALGVGVLCDSEERLIPRESTYLLAVSGLISQCCRLSIEDLFVSYLGGFVLVVACWICANKLSSRTQACLGGGDIRSMFALVLATGEGALIGFGACFLSAAVLSLGGIIRGTFTLQTRLCFAPYLMVWLLVGLL